VDKRFVRHDGMGIAMVLLLSFSASAVQEALERYSVRRRRLEEDSLIMVSRVLSQYIVTHRKFPDSWESFAEFEPNDRNWPRAQWPNDIETVRRLVSIPFGRTVQDAALEVIRDQARILTPTVRRGWNTDGRRSWIIGNCSGEIEETVLEIAN
jgi:hypothetical protein